MGKAYAHRSGNRKGDFYSTPKSLVWVAKDIIKKEFRNSFIFEPANGHGAITKSLREIGFKVGTNDLYHNADLKKNYLYETWGNSYRYVITNPPFSLWDGFVLKAKTHCKKFMFIGRLNYFGTNSRYKNHIWKNLVGVFPFNRYVDYQTPYREDGHFHVGAMPTAWFLWDMDDSRTHYYPPNMVLDVQKYATLGNYKE